MKALAFICLMFDGILMVSIFRLPKWTTSKLSLFESLFPSKRWSSVNLKLEFSGEILMLVKNSTPTHQLLSNSQKQEDF